MGGGVGEGEVVHGIHGEDMDVHVGHFKAGHDDADALWGECLLLGDAYPLGYIHEVGVDLWGEVYPVVGLLARHYQGVAFGDRVDGHEGG